MTWGARRKLVSNKKSVRLMFWINVKKQKVQRIIKKINTNLKKKKTIKQNKVLPLSVSFLVFVTSDLSQFLQSWTAKRTHDI